MEPSPASSSKTQPPVREQPVPTVPRVATNGTPRSITELLSNALYMLLFQQDRHSNKYHWGLYLHFSGEEGGMKYHIRNPGSSSSKWGTDHAVTRGVFKSNFLVGLIRLTQIDPTRRDEAMRLIQQDDGRLNEIPGITCRTWVFRGLENLKSAGLIAYSSIADVENEAIEFGRTHGESTFLAKQPRPLEVSKVCQ